MARRLLLPLLVSNLAAVAVGFVPQFVPRTQCAVSTYSKPLAARQLAFAPRRGRSSTSLSMNLADRFFRVVKANINSIIQNLEDPEKVLEQAVDDMQNDLIKIRQSYAEVSATQKRMDRQKQQADSLANEWYKRAQLALSKGDEELAREALSRRQQQVDVADSLGEQMAIQGEAINKLFNSMQQLEAKITEARAKKDQMIARARTAKTSQKVNDMLSSVTGNTSMDAFERMKEKVEMLESKAEVAGQLSGTDIRSPDSRFKLLESGSKVDDELSKLKGLLTGSKEPAGYLPPANAEVDDELERLRKEMGR